MPRPDYIIVGAGTAGLVAAWALTNKRRNECTPSVLVLEAGENVNKDPLVLDPTIGSANILTYDPKYSTTPVTLEHEIYSIGRAVGGSSAHNGLQAVRGTPDIYNEWAVIANDNRWTYANLLPLFLNQEHYTPDDTTVDHKQRGLDGRLYITQEPPLTDTFSSALATAFGTTLITDYNDHYKISPGRYANTIGVSANQDFITPPPKSVRSYSGNSYLYGIPSVGLPPIVDEKGIGLKGRPLRVKTNSTVGRIIFEDKVAIGVEVIGNKGGERCTKYYYAKKGVILSAGSIYNPALLQLSGYGKRKDLEKLGIKVVVNNKNVGYNMINHYGPNALVQLLPSITPPPARVLNPAFTDLRPYFPADSVRRNQTDFVYPGNASFPQSLLTALNLTEFDSVSVGSTLLRPKSRGFVKISNRDPLTEPLVDLRNYTDTTGPAPWGVTGSDAYAAVSYLKLVQNIAIAQGGTAGNVLFPPPSSYESDSALYQTAVANTLITYHAVGTCRMGTSKDNGVVNGKLKVFGVDNLYIADCSIEPLIQTGNTAYMAYFIGLQLALILGAKLPKH